MHDVTVINKKSVIKHINKESCKMWRNRCIYHL